jgi:hypothetical protein
VIVTGRDRKHDYKSIMIVTATVTVTTKVWSRRALVQKYIGLRSNGIVVLRYSSKGIGIRATRK